jgi:hypothetical protein
MVPHEPLKLQGVFVLSLSVNSTSISKTSRQKQAANQQKQQKSIHSIPTVKRCLPPLSFLNLESENFNDKKTFRSMNSIKKLLLHFISELNK